MHAPPASSPAIRNAVVAAVDDPNAPASAWPDRFPGRWATAARIAEIVGRSGPEIAHTLRELGEKGEIVSAQPWPGNLRGYRPAANSAEPLFAVATTPPTPENTRQWMLDELRRWAATHDGAAPSRADWSKSRDPDRHWPRSTRVAELFEGEAMDTGQRWFTKERCENCECATGRHYRNEHGAEFCEGCFDCLGECPHGDNGEWHGPSGWRYALQLAGLEVRTGADMRATPARTLGRNRQMVTGGAADQRPQHFQR